MPFTTLYFTTPQHQERHTFDTAEDLAAWDAMVHSLKAESQKAYEGKEAAGGINKEVRALCDQWMNNVKAFRDRFGEDKVPADIKWALNTAEEGLEIEVTQWTNPPDRTLFE